MTEIPLRDKTGTVVAVALVDDEDAWLADYRWSLHSTGYARRRIRLGRGRGATQRTIYLHRAVLGLEHGSGTEVDHINHDQLDNRRANLRVGSKSQNQQNRGPRKAPSSSRYRGVTRHKTLDLWRACATLDGKPRHLGYFKREEEAAEAARAFRAEQMPFAVEV